MSAVLEDRTVWYPRPIGPHPLRCAPCGRLIGFVDARLGPCALLPEPACCAYCSRPVSEEAQAKAPRDGIVALVNAARRTVATRVDWYGGAA